MTNPIPKLVQSYLPFWYFIFASCSLWFRRLCDSIVTKILNYYLNFFIKLCRWWKGSSSVKNARNVPSVLTNTPIKRVEIVAGQGKRGLTVLFFQIRRAQKSSLIMALNTCKAVVYNIWWPHTFGFVNPKVSSAE